MSRLNHQVSVSALAIGCALAWGGLTAHADRDGKDRDGSRIKKVFVIAMENHNWTQPNPQSTPQQIR